MGICLALEATNSVERASSIPVGDASLTSIDPVRASKRTRFGFSKEAMGACKGNMSLEASSQSFRNHKSEFLRG